MLQSPTLPEAILREIAVASQTHPRSVARVARGEHLRTPLAERRIIAAMRARGLEPLALEGSR